MLFQLWFRKSSTKISGTRILWGNLEVYANALIPSVCLCEWGLNALYIISRVDNRQLVSLAVAGLVFGSFLNSFLRQQNQQHRGERIWRTLHSGIARSEFQICLATTCSAFQQCQTSTFLQSKRALCSLDAVRHSGAPWTFPCARACRSQCLAPTRLCTRRRGSRRRRLHPTHQQNSRQAQTPRVCARSAECLDNLPRQRLVRNL